MPWIRWSGLGGVVIGLAACQSVIDLPAVDPPPVIEALLLADSTSTLLRATWPAPSTMPSAPPRPIPPNAVSLRLAGPTGSTTLRPVLDSTGFFRAHLRIVRGRSYWLTGVVSGRVVRATTKVPSGFTVLAPAADTIDLARTIPLARTGFRWRALGAGVFFARGARLTPAARPQTRDTVGYLLLDTPEVAPTSTVTLFAITPEADAYLFGVPTGRSNVTGSFGYFAAGIAVRKVVRWH